MRINSPDWYPSYLNPSFAEILEMAKEGWDTMRILTSDNDIVIASGLGNTHSSLVVLYAKAKGYYKGVKGIRPDGSERHMFSYSMPTLDAAVLHHSNGIAFFNVESTGGGQYDRFDKAEKHFTSEQCEILKDLIRESGLAL